MVTRCNNAQQIIHMLDSNRKQSNILTATKVAILVIISINVKPCCFCVIVTFNLSDEKKKNPGGVQVDSTAEQGGKTSICLSFLPHFHDL